jgi:hypothetical protein
MGVVYRRANETRISREDAKNAKKKVIDRILLTVNDRWMRKATRTT